MCIYFPEDRRGANSTVFNIPWPGAGPRDCVFSLRIRRWLRRRATRGGRSPRLGLPGGEGRPPARGDFALLRHPPHDSFGSRFCEEWAVFRASRPGAQSPASPLPIASPDSPGCFGHILPQPLIFPFFLNYFLFSSFFFPLTLTSPFPEDLGYKPRGKGKRNNI